MIFKQKMALNDKMQFETQPSSIYEYYRLFLFMENNFHSGICEEIFGDLSDHIFQKWLNSDGNIIKFLSHLDTENLSKMLDWFQKEIKYNIYMN